MNYIKGKVFNIWQKLILKTRAKISKENGLCLWKEGLKKLLPDSLFIRLMYFHIKGRALHLKNPKSFNEKLQWMKALLS